jgi:ferric-dicitrate binding protein FerR (iron transport regulator)
VLIDETKLDLKYCRKSDVKRGVGQELGPFLAIFHSNAPPTASPPARVTPFPESFDAESREVELKGEAFFSVARRENKPFLVHTKEATVQVLGTKFNVKSRPDYFQVYCFEGSVKVIHESREFILEQGEFYKVVEDEIFTGKAVAGDIPGWIVEESRFRAVPLKQVIAEMERQFDIKIETENVDLEQRFTGSFSHSDIEVALEAITAPLRLNYRIETGGKVILYDK